MNQGTRREFIQNAGYRGWVGIESGGTNQPKAVRKTREVLEQVREKLADEYS